MKRLVGFFTVLAVLMVLALPVLGDGQETCPEGDGWVKVDNLDGQSYTYDVPEGFEVTNNCFKAGADGKSYDDEGNKLDSALVFGSGSTVNNTTVFNQNGKLRDISHASFLLVAIEEEEEEEETPTTTIPEEPSTTLPPVEPPTTIEVTPIPPITEDPDETTTTTVAPPTPSTIVEPPAADQPVELPFTGIKDWLAFPAGLFLLAGYGLIRRSKEMS